MKAAIPGGLLQPLLVLRSGRTMCRERRVKDNEGDSPALNKERRTGGGEARVGGDTGASTRAEREEKKNPTHFVENHL